MKLAVATCVLLSVASATEHKATMTPTQKVIQLMDKMKATGVAEMQAEKDQFAKYQDFCYSSLKNKERSAMELTEKISSLEANIEENTASESTLQTEIAQHNMKLDTATKDKEDRTAVRNKEAEDFGVVKKDYEDSIEAIGKAKTVLAKQSHTRAQAESLLQLGMDLHPKQATSALRAFLQDVSKQPAAAGYEFQSQGVVSMLDDLQSKFLKEKRDYEMEEQKKINSYDLVSTSLAHEIDQQTSHIAKKTGFRSSAMQELASDKAALEQAKTDKAADAKYSKDLKAECSQKEVDFSSRQKLRGEEIEAIEKATEIIKSRVSATDEKHMPGRFLQTGASALASLRSKKAPSKIQDAVSILEKKAVTLGSRTLSLIASQVASNAPEGATKGDAAIAKIKDMLTTLLAKLQKQAADETGKKGYCDKELAANKLTRVSKTDAKDTLTSEVEQLSTSVAKLTNENSELSADITQMVQAMGEANVLRLEDKKKNAQTIKEAEGAKKAVGEALVVLQDFYEKAGQATSLAQEEPGEKPETFDKPYTGMGGQSGGVMGMLQVIMEDFSRLVSATSSAESIASKEHQKFTEDNRIDKAEKDKTIEANKERIAEQTTMLEERKNDLKSTEVELEAANKYYRELHSQCLDSNKAAVEAEEQRREEIASLEEAKAALA
eukprot:TRINITY_DN10299_c0_g4_i1.p1 TRINITY_DN10299_c0_g4~~TRINITY_DN10299_c0_g4_i1.p1  ORF type:complete len:666 (+),score=225.74 TRINITY_DN10299_c0_g4_i1:133-2130(+)